MPKTSELLIARLQSLGIIHTSEVATFERLYPGYLQRSAGAWTWKIQYGPFEIGSQYTVRQCLQSKRLVELDSGEIIAE